ncbi:mitochondrial thiamine pyrophosphate carrier [Octopus bimaculoides]|uniref:Mitochondrial thiamine pyrophosphate carrier n=1 Tax=Octopus bimaculoides TaxID=37653 RepID=A0A0L8GMG1_OCTBM|nr:mitochondrial thiamine pyrophosphate carrier [Octopus bimaculoides]XP_014779969.1 mitochondrial thiamine pyrophosphate carrier [Octopus bimaculoides]|eukprot:XP_014779968.1 PREDICTED: mitochondrial thiamine pyrophosphate carrier-like [Octopus bimaculoides]
MVGYNPNQDHHLTYYDYAFAGALSGAVSRLLLQPLDVVKIRLQLQIEPVSKFSIGSKYHGFLHTIVTMSKEEGVKALWKGHIPAQFLTVFYGMVQFSSYEFFSKLTYHCVPNEFFSKNKPLISLVCGSMSGAVSTVVVQPIDLLRTRFVAQGEPKVYKSIFSAGVRIVQQEGILGFWCGIGPSLVLVAPQTGLTFGFHTVFTSILGNDRKTHSTFSIENQIKTFISGLSSGMSAKLIVYPFDVVKKRLQVQGFKEARCQFGKVRSYSGMVSCLQWVFFEEGIRGLYKGLFPTMLKAGSVSGVTFMMYEMTCGLLSKWR